MKIRLLNVILEWVEAKKVEKNMRWLLSPIKSVKKNKSPTKKLQKYLSDQFEEAKLAVSNRNLSFKPTAEVFELPKLFFYEAIKRYNCHVLWRKPALSKEVETMLLNTHMKLVDLGYGISFVQIEKIFREYLVQAKTLNLAKKIFKIKFN